MQHALDPEGLPYRPEALDRKPDVGAEGFFALDLRSGRVTAVEPFPEARSPSWKLTVDFGPVVGELQTAAKVTNYGREGCSAARWSVPSTSAHAGSPVSRASSWCSAPWTPTAPSGCWSSPRASGPARRSPDDMDAIEIRGLRAFGRHGVLDFERELGQVFVVDCVLEVDLTAASASDALADTVDYGLLAGRLAHAVTTTRFRPHRGASRATWPGSALEDPGCTPSTCVSASRRRPSWCRSTTSRCGCAAAVAGDGGLRGTTAGWLAAVLPALGAPDGVPRAGQQSRRPAAPPAAGGRPPPRRPADDRARRVVGLPDHPGRRPGAGRLPQPGGARGHPPLPARPAAPLPGGRGRPPPRPRGALGSPHDRRRPAAVRQPGRAHPPPGGPPPPPDRARLRPGPAPGGRTRLGPSRRAARGWPPPWAASPRSTASR